MQVVTKVIKNLAVTTAKIAANAVTGAKILLGNTEYLRGRNAANSADVNVLKVNSSDEIDGTNQWNFVDQCPDCSIVPTNADDLTNKAYVDAQIGGGGITRTSNTVSSNTVMSTTLTGDYILNVNSSG